MIRRPPRSTLFPCATRCRSRFPVPRADELLDLDVRAGLLANLPPRGLLGVLRRLDLSARQYPGAAIDRKSTRLNSSHANISYAVFCLKKKKSTVPRAARWSV